jgi:hypothetical protein
MSAEGEQLTLIVDKGIIISAECGEAQGIDALARAVSWKQGIWSVDPCDIRDLPAPNLNRDIAGALLEACIEHDTSVVA